MSIPQKGDSGSREPAPRFYRLLLLLLLWANAASAELADASPQRVLLVFTGSTRAQASLRLGQGLRKALESDSGRRVELFEEYLDKSRFPLPEQEEAFAQHLKARYAKEPAIVVAIGEGAFQMLRSRKEWLFRNTPLVFLGVPREKLEKELTDPRISGIPMSAEIAPTIDAMRKMIPTMTTVVLVSGAADYDRTWDPMVAEEEKRLRGLLSVEYWRELKLSEVKARAASLPETAAVVYLSYLRDPGGATMTGAEAALEVARASSVPVFGLYDSYLNGGIVGGYMPSFEKTGTLAGELILRVLNGEAIPQGGLVPPPPSRFIFDARELKRWKISRGNLPADSELRFDRLPFWRDHPHFTIWGGLALVVEGGLIALLLQHRSRWKRVASALRLSEEQYRDVVDTQTEMVCRFLPDTTLTFVNEAYCRYFGRRREELLGRQFVELIPEESRGAVEGLVRRVLKERDGKMTEHEVVRADGTVGWMEWHDTVILNEAGEVVELQGIGRDITERFRAVQARIEAERHLSQAARLALVGELTASIAHEINQPLGAILSNAEAAELLLDGAGHQDIREILADIRRDDLRASEIIKNIRNLVARKAVEFEPIQLNKKVRNVLRFISHEAEKRQVRIVTELDKELPLLSGDRAQLEQLLLNLALNGIDAMSDTPVAERTLLIKTSLHDSETVELEISDSGHGIPSDLTDRIFESFFTTKSDGMGLGLALARSIAELHGGSISAQNRPAGGATFRLRLPLEAPHAVQGASNDRNSR